MFFKLEKNEADDETKNRTFYSKTNAKTIINDSEYNNKLESIYSTIISKRGKPLGKYLSWVIDSVIDHTIKNINL